MNAPTYAGRRRHVTIVAASLVALTIAHFASPPHLHDLHGLLFKATFVPLILAGVWFHVRGAAICSGLTSGAYLIHVFTQLHGHQEVWAWVADIVLYNVVALTTGVISERRAEALAGAEAQAKELHENARALLAAEEVIRRSERHRTLGELAAGMAHEIRNPLGGIRGAAEVLRKPDTSQEAREEFGSLLEDEIARLDGVVRNVLEFSRPQADGASEAIAADVAEGVLMLLKPDIDRWGIQAANAVPADLRLAADPHLVRQVLLNLCLNAVQAQPDGGSLKIIGKTENGRAVLIVEDGGPGVPEQLREQLFDAYVSGRREGSGLGLPIAARLVKGLGGELNLEASGPSGATFAVELPLVPNAE